MKKLLATLLAVSLVLCVAGCGKKGDSLAEASTSADTSAENQGGAESATGIDSITFNGITLAFPCKVQDVINALSGVNTLEEDLDATVVPGETKFCSIFDYNNTSFGVINLSDTEVAVKDCYVVMVSTSISLSAPSFSVGYPAGIEYDKEFDKEKVYEILGEPSYTNTTDVGENFQFEQDIENQGDYKLSVTVKEDGVVGMVSFMVLPDTNAQSAENTETVESTPSEDIVTEEAPVVETPSVAATDNKYASLFRMQEIIYDESGLVKSEEELGLDLTASSIQMKTHGVVIDIPCNVQDFLNLNPAVEWDISTETINPGEFVNYSLPYLNTAIALTVSNPTDKELKASEGIIISLQVNSAYERCNELNSFELEFPAGIRMGEEVDINTVAAAFGGEPLVTEYSDRIEYQWMCENITYFSVTVNKETNLVSAAAICSFGDELAYAEPTVTTPTPYTSPFDNMNAVEVDVQRVADGTNEVMTYAVGANELQLPGTVQELLDKTGLVLPEQYTYYQVVKGQYMTNIPLHNAEGVTCLLITVYNSDLGTDQYITSGALVGVAQPANPLIPEEYLLKTE